MKSSDATGARSWAVIEQLAVTFAQQYKFDPDRERLGSLVKRLHGEVVVLHQSQNFLANSKCLEINPSGRFRILLRSDAGPNEDRVIIARMIGHFYLHTGEPPGSDKSRRSFGLVYDEKHLELVREANRFACCLLMPADAFQKARNYFLGDLTQIAISFGVTLPYAEQRLNSFSMRKE